MRGAALRAYDGPVRWRGGADATHLSGKERMPKTHEPYLDLGPLDLTRRH
jgi:hypothetical protein